VRLNRIGHELGSNGTTLVHEVPILGMTMQQVGERRGLTTPRWKTTLRGACRNAWIGSR
jgi:hypothetical protein